MSALVLNFGADMVEATTLCDDTHTMKGGLKSVTMAHEGFWSGGDGDVDDVLFDNLAIANTPISIAPTDGADGELAYTMQSILAEYTPGAAIGEMFAISVTAEASEDGLIRGTIMHNATRSSSGSGTARQLGAVAAGQSMFAALHVLSGSGTLDVIVQSDDDVGMASPTTQITFNQATGVEAQWGEAAGAITDDWWQIDYTIAGGSPSFEFVVVLGIK
jgi:hypothetical protein